MTRNGNEMIQKKPEGLNDGREGFTPVKKAPGSVLSRVRTETRTQVFKIIDGITYKLVNDLWMTCNAEEYGYARAYEAGC